MFLCEVLETFESMWTLSMMYKMYIHNIMIYKMYEKKEINGFK